MTLLDRVLGSAAAVVATIGIAWASSARTAPHVSDDAVLRLAWTARPERVEDCRPQSTEALEKLPAHMRQTLVCEGTTASYRLEVRREGKVIAGQIVRGGGLHHDRPLYVFREIPVPAGDTAISVRFVRIESTTAIGADARAGGDAPVTGSASRDAGPGSSAIDPERRRRESEERFWQRGEAAPATLLLEDRIHFVAREVILVTYDAERRELVAVREPLR
jgi:hypothetical protein